MLESFGRVIYLSIRIFLAHICFRFVSLSLILAKCLIPFKILQGNFGNLTTVNNFLPLKSMFSVIRGGNITRDLVGYVNCKLETPLAIVGYQSSPKSTP